MSPSVGHIPHCYKYNNNWIRHSTLFQTRMNRICFHLLLICILCFLTCTVHVSRKIQIALFCMCILCFCVCGSDHVGQCLGWTHFLSNVYLNQEVLLDASASSVKRCGWRVLWLQSLSHLHVSVKQQFMSIKHMSTNVVVSIQHCR